MIKVSNQYDLFFDFIDAYSPSGFTGIDRHDPLMLSLEKMLNNNNQFLMVFDMLNMKNVFTTMGSIQMLGINPVDLSSYHFKEATHPDDLKRHELGLTKLFKIAHDLFVARKGDMLISSDFRFRNTNGIYNNHLIQCYFFYVGAPFDSVYILHIYTDISWCKKLKNGYHYYLGNDLSYFRFPDEELLMKGNIFSDREFEIIRLIQSGLSSEQIAEKLFLSKHTVNTHRKNILDKTGKAHISDLIFSLVQEGLL